MTPTPSAWTQLRARVDPFTRRTLGLYSAYELTPEEYVTTVGNDNNALSKLCRDIGYEPQVLSAAKRHPGSGRLHVMSLRRRPSTHPPAALGSGLDDYDPRECQLHLHAFNTDVSGFVDVFTHYELAPDLRRLGNETWGGALARWREHYRPQYDFDHVDFGVVTYLRGIQDPALDLNL